MPPTFEFCPQRDERGRCISYLPDSNNGENLEFSESEIGNFKYYEINKMLEVHVLLQCTS